MSEASKLEKFAEIKYLLLIISFILLLDIYLLYVSKTNLISLNINYLNSNIGIFIIFLCLFSLYIAIATKVIITFFTMIFEIFKIKKNINQYNIEYNKLLTKAFIENNSVIYNYTQDKIKENKNMFEGITLYYGIILLFIFDWKYCNNSIINILILNIGYLLHIDNLYINIYTITFIYIIIFLMSVFPFMLLKDYISEKNLIRINPSIKKNIVKKKYK